MYDLLTISGPTASGKTKVAAYVCAQISGEIISADSRQVYRGMNIGTGKDLADYSVNGQTIPYHLIDILDAGGRYNISVYQKDFLRVYNEIRERGKFPVLCGGSGLYIDAVVSGYQLIPGKKSSKAISSINNLYVGLSLTREQRRERITVRLHQRLQEGMVDEAQRLLQEGVTVEDMLFYGLEYKFLALYLTGKLPYNEMVEHLNAAIHQFAKRQMTWFRSMKRKGMYIHWIDATLPLDEKVQQVVGLLNRPAEPLFGVEKQYCPK
ncbi:MAG: tRNA (adenosine(37)-N6)-dimethylallyltransferase MiaA [Prevotellaceae bacterium]|jgi:tRNA dimethylallyltransferase|nr:tRNA (adenosine(37)-N6)-dimethylallyltransferase MiaA [Prevotellaceae bacterium]